MIFPPDTQKHNFKEKILDFLMYLLSTSQTDKNKIVVKLQEHVNQHMRDVLGIGKKKLGSRHDLFYNDIISLLYYMYVFYLV